MRPFNELTEAEKWQELAAACLGCGLRRDPFPEVIEMWMCPDCIRDFHLSLEGSDDPGNRFVHRVTLAEVGTDPFPTLERRLLRDFSLPAPVSGSVED